VKFDRSRPRVWLYFAVTAINILLASAVAYLLPSVSRDRRRGVLSGHLFNGNLRAFYDVAGREAFDWTFRYVYIDYDAYRSREKGEGDTLTSLRIDHMIWIARSDVVMTDHGPGIWKLLQRLRPNLAFVDVWHGVGFKSLGPGFGKKMARYRALFVASEWDGEASYVAAGRVSTQQIAVTGYAATDSLVAQDASATLDEGFASDSGRKGLLLIAPTWSHGDRNRSTFPFETDEQDFLTRINEWAVKREWTVVFRAHLNADLPREHGHPNVRFMPLVDYPLTYELLEQADILVTDWSSIATDYLVLGRPIIFLDTPPPFHPDRLTADDRVGYRVADWQAFAEALDLAALRPDDFAGRFGSQRESILQKAFGTTLDGHSADRYLEALNHIVNGTRS
jgi:hypothetical protein